MKTLKSTGSKLVLSTSFVVGLLFVSNNNEASAFADPSEYSPQPDQSETTTIQADVLRVDDRGQDVRNLQQDLIYAGYTVSDDGIYGSETENAVTSFQQDHGLQVDGIAGPATQGALGNVDASTPRQESDIEVTETSSESSEPTVTTTDNSTSSNLSQSIADTATSVLGTPYAWGGSSTAGMDSSGFVNYVFQNNGISVERTHAGMWANTGVHVSLSDLQIGDVLFYEGTYNTQGASHSGVYVGNGQMIHSGGGSEGVSYADINNSYWQQHFIGVKRFY
ncbi:C40 family peptidase [Shouchella sp. JSM 1781072]|uniref:C40 family peptidase n=1 Tax=Bacillaceae TaxID=186817 RepID=UPI0020D0856C|nr:NlpC/P60 family protein [Alkalihalobacillus sp. LMS6]UTR06023.1 NlpC/P60 family protein [Alkalihalobacillus sp. LMS6]